MKSTNRYEILKQIYLLNARMSWTHKIQGVDISRCFEYTEAYLQLITTGLLGSVLDVGSYRSPFPAFLLQKGYKVSIIDVDYSVVLQRKWIRRAVGCRERLFIILGDGTRQPFSDSCFDIITCISTIEHLPKDGDVHMAGEIGRILKPGGYSFFSVPYDISAKEGRWGKWFQRWYNLPTAISRLVEPSGLRLISYGYLMGGKIGKLADIWYSLPRIVRHSFSWSHIFLFSFAYEEDDASEHDARVLWLLLQR